jgi:hypothetical protein
VITMYLNALRERIAAVEGLGVEAS